MYTINGKRILNDLPWTDEVTGVQYPANWLRLSTPAEKEALGLVEIQPPPSEQKSSNFDRRFWMSPTEPKDLQELKTQWLAKVRSKAKSLLDKTDWYVIRKVETNIPIPQDVADHRVSVRVNSDQKEQGIDEAVDVTTLKDYVTSSKFWDW